VHVCCVCLCMYVVSVVCMYGVCTCVSWDMWYICVPTSVSMILLVCQHNLFLTLV
jgi:hypothetical protein